MNQILYKKIKLKNYKRKYIFVFLLSIILTLLSIIYLIWFYYSIDKKEKYSNHFLNSFSIESLYSEASSNKNINNFENTNDIFIIGIVEIPKIKIKYPFFSTVNDELLRIAPCKFYGPMPNMIGNLCIAGHNYDDNRFFGKLYELNIGDSILISDLNGNIVTYNIYKKYEILASDTTCTNQNTLGRKEITLITCNNQNKNRLVIKACE